MGPAPARSRDALLRARRRDGVGRDRPHHGAAAVDRHRRGHVISGGHITLRPWERSDIAFIYDSWQDAEMQRWTHVHPYTALDAATFIEMHARPQPEQDGAFFAIIRTDNDEVLGSISFEHIDWDLGVADAGYWVSAESRGDGVATSALESLVE